MKKTVTILALIIIAILFAFVACDSNPASYEPSGSSSSETGASGTPLTLEFIKSGTLSFTNPRDSLKYSKNGGARTAVSGSIAVAAGDVISLYAKAVNQTDSHYLIINCTSDCYVYGNVMSLLDSENYATDVDISVNYALYGLFENNTHIKNHPTNKLVLPATTLASYCYEYMFYCCTGLTEAPELPATTLASYCYDGMFSGCTGLTAAPELPATTLASYCYHYMFSGCTELTTAPELPATALASNCYSYMFIDCAGLTTAPELPATTLADGCYGNMFSGCTGLTTAPELPATTLAYFCYHYMFSGCTGLTAAPELPATTLAFYCYEHMFYGCTNLSSITCLATNISVSNCTGDWLYGVASNGTFTKASTMNNWGTGASGIPSGWTVVNK